jgi:TRAP-type transport system periplasmic protein
MGSDLWTRRGFVTATTTAALVQTSVRPARSATILRWATVLTASHPSVLMMEKVAAELREQTGGEMEIQTFPSSQLGSSRDIIEATSSGAIQMVDEGAAQFGQFVAPFSILEAPYLWRDPAHVRRALSATLMEGMRAELIAKRQMRLIGSTYYGTRHVTSGSRAIHSVGDMNGFKLRIPEVDTYRSMAEAWGARPTPLNFGELYLALSQGAVDGEENPLPTIQSAKFFEVQKFLILTAHILTPRIIVMNEAAWQSLLPRHRELLLASLTRHGQTQDDEIARQEAALAQSFRAAGMTVIEPDLDSFRKPVLATLPTKFENKWGKGLWDKVAAA